MNGDYPAIWLGGKSQHIHRLNWENHYGSIPNGYIIHHKDGNKLNWDIDNLELLSRCEHVNEHRDVVKQKGVKVVARKDCIELEFNTIKEAAEFCGTYTACIDNCFKGKQCQSNGWTFERGE